MVKKLKFYNNFKISNIHKNSILLVGNFDGLHLGHQKIIEKWGHRTSMIRALDRVIQSMIEWNVITKSNSFLYVNEPIEIKETDLLLWFLECLFKAENVQTMTYENLISSLTKFPFVINLPSYYVKKSKRFEYYIQGTNLETVSLKNAM